MKIPLLFLLSTQVFSTVIGDAVKLMQPRSWRPIIAQGMTGDMTHSGPVMDQIYAFGHSACWDVNTDQLLFIGGAHYAPMRFNIYKAETNLWRPESLPACASDLGWVSHSYDNLTVTDSGDYYHLYRGTMYRYNAPTAVWGSQLPGLGDSRYGSLTHFPEMNSLFYVLGGTISRFNLTTRTWSTFRTGVAMGGYHNIGQYSPTHHVMILGGGVESSVLHILDSTGSLRQTTAAPFTVELNASLLATEPVTGDFLFLTPDSVYLYHVAEDSWEAVAKTMVSNIAQAAITGVPTYGCVAVISVTNYPFLLFKYANTSSVSKQGQNNPVREITVSPNPFNPGTDIFLPEGNAKVTIFNVSGRRVADFRTITGRKLVWNAHGSPAGLYLLMAETGNRTYCKTISLIK